MKAKQAPVEEVEASNKSLSGSFVEDSMEAPVYFHGNGFHGRFHGSNGSN